MTKQLAFAFKTYAHKSFENFYPVGNEELALRLQSPNTSQWHYLFGVAGAGVSHLLQACASWHALPYVSLREKGILSLLRIEQGPGLILDDFDAVEGNASLAEGLFHYYNRIPKPLCVIGARQPLKNLSIPLPDLVSRLSQGYTYRVHALDDEGKKVVLSAFAQSRGMDISPRAIDFLMKHLPRELGGLIHIIEWLDEQSLRLQRHLTIPCIKQLLAHYPNGA